MNELIINKKLINQEILNWKYLKFTAALNLNQSGSKKQCQNNKNCHFTNTDHSLRGRAVTLKYVNKG